MTRHRQQFTRDGAGYVFQSARTKRLSSKLSLVAKNNAARVPCEICGLGILPGAMQAHIDIVHGGDE